jgi:ubiquinone/menaquinone biosynthesis C-methylase UbiE
MKDNFSAHADQYARFRPGYPEALFQFLYQHCTDTHTAWDCGTGNGQIAVQLARQIQLVEATDISANQLQNATPHPRVRYSQQSAESASFADQSFDLIVVGQAAHWFHLPEFYKQVHRVAKPGCLLALVGYNLLQFEAAPLNQLLFRLYKTVLGNYWDAERHHVDAAYTTLHFPFHDIPLPPMAAEYQWLPEQLLGYLGTWSAAQHFVRQHQQSPIDAAFLSELESLWLAGVTKTVRFPLFARVARVQGV